MNKKKFILIHLVSPFTTHDEAEKELEELKSLVNTFGGGKIVHIIQRKMHPDPGMYVGKGKAEEIKDMVEKDHIDAIVINAIVKPNQLFNLTKMIWPVNPDIHVWDRIDLILHIFEKHAHTAEAKLQIELARMRHMGPRIYGLGLSYFSRQAGGIGGRGIGETNIELMKRHWRNEMKVITDRLEKMSEQREHQLNRRRELGLQTVSIVGYTNAGKSTLFNSLTKKRNLSADVLFATLESTVGKLYLPSIKKEIIVSDTIGFIQNLPPNLIQAFKSTLMESVNADLLLHVIDASDHLMHEKIQVVEAVLTDLGLEHKKQIYVFNKVDAAKYLHQQELEEAYVDYNPQFVSAKNRDGLENLVTTIESAI